jgi:hypothetical protein
VATNGKQEAELAKPTPAPALVFEKQEGDEWWFGGNGGAEIVIRPTSDDCAAVAVLPSKWSTNENEDYARLFCAAPNLHAYAKAEELRERYFNMKRGDDVASAQKAFRDQLASMGYGPEHCDDFVTFLATYRAAALAKAEGVSNG